MKLCFRRFVCRYTLLPFCLPLICMLALSGAHGQSAKHTDAAGRIADQDADHEKERDAWFYRGRIVPGKNSAELRHRAYRAKLEMRKLRAATAKTATAGVPVSLSGPWTPLGPVPLASDASGMGVQNYNQVSGRATAVAIDPADPTGNTVYVGGAQGGVWQSTNGANPTANSITWTPLADDQATLSIGSIAIQPGNTNPAQSVILAGTGEADNTGDSYYGLGILVSTNAGNSWTLVPSANSGALSFSGLGGTRMAFSTAMGQTNTVVAAMAASSEGAVSGALTGNAMPGLYTSTDAGQTWTYDALLDPGNQPTDATSATSVVYNAGAGMFLAAVRFHGFYSSPDGVNWTRLANQPGNGALDATACPPISSSNNFSCPIYRAEITAVAGRNEMYVWMISLDGNGAPVDGFIWQTLDGGNTWTQIDDNGITNCGDSDGCGVDQGYYNLELMAMPNGAATDLYAGAINVYKCSVSSINPTCATSGFLNLTHVYGCDPIAAPSNLHPDQHALAFAIPTAGSDNGAGLIYFANDGGVYRALNGYTGLNTGSCSGTNQFDDLNQNLGSMTQFVAFSQHPSDPNTMLGGTQDNGSPGASTATTNLAWGNVNGGDGGFNAIDPNSTLNWYTSNPDVPPGGLNIQECSNGVNCHAQNFSVVVGSNDVGGDDGGFYFPYLLDPQSSSTLVVGTCRVWRGPRLGGNYTVLSPNFDTLGTGACSGSEVNLVRGLAAGGPADSNGSEVIYAATDGPGPLGPGSPTGGNVWVTTNARTTPLAQVMQSINPNQFPVSSVAIDPSDPSGNTAYITIMGFTGGAGHFWKTANAGATWTDFTGTGGATLPDAPANAIVVDGSTAPSTVFVGTDVGVFFSGAGAPSWSEVGPDSGSGQSGFLPNVAVTALAIFSSGSQKLLRASTYGRGIWQFNLNPAPDFQISIPDTPQTIAPGQMATFSGAATFLNRYNNNVTLICLPGATAPPSTCTPNPNVVSTVVNTFTVSAAGAAGDYYFNIQGVGSDPNQITHAEPVVLHIGGDFSLTGPGAIPTVNAGSTTDIPISVTAISPFSGIVNLSCSAPFPSCAVNPASPTVGAVPIPADVPVNATAMTYGPYQLLVTGFDGSVTHTLPVSFNVVDYQLSGTKSLTIAPGAQGTATITITPLNSYSGQVQAFCNATALPQPTCPNPAGPIIVGSAAPVQFMVTIGVNASTAPGVYNVIVSTNDTSGEPAHNFTIAVTVPAAGFTLTPSPPAQTVTAGQTAAYQLSVAPSPPGSSFPGAVALSCTQGLPAGAQCIFGSTPVTPGGSPVNMTISTSATTPTGTSTVTVTGASGSLINSTTLSLIVQAPPAIDFTLTAPSAITAYAGTPAMAILTLTSTATQTIQVNLSCNDSSLPSAQSCSPLTPANPVMVNPGASVQVTATVNIPSTASPGTYNISLSAQDSTGSQTVSFPLTLVPDFTVTNGTPTQTITAGQTTGAYQLSVAPNPTGSSFPGAVTLSCVSLTLPPGAQCIFVPSTPVTPGGTAVNVVLTISTTGATSSLQKLAPTRRYFFAIGMLLPGIVIAWGAAGRYRGHWRKTVLLAILLALAIWLPSCAGGATSGGSGSATTSQTTAGNYTITVTGTSGALAHNTSVGLDVESP